MRPLYSDYYVSLFPPDSLSGTEIRPRMSESAKAFRGKSLGGVLMGSGLVVRVLDAFHVAFVCHRLVLTRIAAPMRLDK